VSLGIRRVTKIPKLGRLTFGHSAVNAAPNQLLDPVKHRFRVFS
jgi:hypothetical protein